jgi:glutamate--cysteine ligase
MYLIYRNGTPINMAHTTFREFWKKGSAGHRALTDDWKLHLTTLFPEVRLKGGFIEVRGADMGDLAHQMSLGAIWKGILYSDEACAAAYSLLSDLRFEERIQLGKDVARLGLAATLRGQPIWPIAKELVAISKRGLSAIGEDTSFLQVAEEIVHAGMSPAEQMIKRFDGDLPALLRDIALRA